MSPNHLPTNLLTTPGYQHAYPPWPSSSSFFLLLQMVFRNVKTSLEYATEEPEAAEPQRRPRHHERRHLHQALQLRRRRSLQAEVRVAFIIGTNKCPTNL